MTCANETITIVKGKTFSRVYRWGALPIIYKAISAVTKTAPVVVTATGHGLVDGWPVAITNVGGMVELNAVYSPPAASDYAQATYVDANTISINSVNAAGYTTYTSGGYLQYYTPVDMNGYSARFQIRASIDATGTPLVALTSSAGITIDNTAKTITVTIAATATDDLSFTNGVYELEMESGTGVVTRLVSGPVVVEGEVVR